MATATGTFPAPLATDPTAFTAPLILASQSYTIDGTWDNRASNNAGAWRFTWRTSDGTIIFAGKKVVLTEDFFAPFHYKAGVPPGRLQIRRPDNSTADPGLKDLAGGVIFEYITDD